MTPVQFSLPAVQPFDGAGVTRFLSAHAIEGVEAVRGGEYWRSLALPHGQGLVAVRADSEGVVGRAWLSDTDDLTPLTAAVARLYDLDADAPAIDRALAVVPELGASLRAAPGIRMPGSTDANETLFRTLIGQQVSVKAARTVQGRLAEALGDPLVVGPSAARDELGLGLLFPTASQIADGGTGVVRGPASRVRTILGVAQAVADGSLVLEASPALDMPPVLDVPPVLDGSLVLERPGQAATVQQFMARLEALPGIGPWTAGYVAMRVLGAPDILLDGDLALRAGAAALGLASERRELVRYAERVAPWRSYFGMHLWRDAVAVIAG